MDRIHHPGKKWSGSRIRLKMVRIQDLVKKWTGSRIRLKMVRIQDLVNKWSGSRIRLKNGPDPQHWFHLCFAELELVNFCFGCSGVVVQITAVRVKLNPVSWKIDTIESSDEKKTGSLGAVLPIGR